jgi:hypothetical protein
MIINVLKHAWTCLNTCQNMLGIIYMLKQTSLILGNILMKTFVLWKHARIMRRMIYMFWKMPKYAETCRNMSIYYDEHAKTSQKWLICFEHVRIMLKHVKSFSWHVPNV